MTNPTLEEMLVKLDSHIKVDEASLAFVISGQTRIETAVLDHAKTSADTLDKMNVRTHARMDSLVTSITKLADGQIALKDDLHDAILSLTKNNDDVKNDLHKRINSTKDWVMSGLIAVSLPVMAWMAMIIYDGMK